jgi:hypothetical protein
MHLSFIVSSSVGLIAVVSSRPDHPGLVLVLVGVRRRRNIHTHSLIAKNH